jgi:translocation and assembly module TamA
MPLLRYLLLVLLSLPLLAHGKWRIAAQPSHVVDELERALSAYQTPPNADDLVAQSEFSAAVTGQVKETLSALGYYAPSVQVDLSNSDPRLDVQAGVAVVLQEANIQLIGEASTDADFRLPTFPLKPGQRFIHADYESFKQAVADSALERGYFDSRWLVHRVELNLLTNQANVFLAFQSGPRYRYGDISFQERKGGALTALDQKQLDRLMTFKSGDFISSRDLFNLQNDLIQTGYFRDVQVSFRRDSAENLHIPVDVIVDSRLPSRISLGAGFTTDVGPRVLAEWQRHLFNEKGHGIEVKSEFSMVRQSGEVRYRVPWKHPLHDRLEFAVGAQQDIIDGTETLQTIVSMQRVIAPKSGWQQTYGIRVLDERFERESGEKGSETLVAPYLAYSRLRSSGGVDPTHGLRLLFQAETANQAFLSSVDYVSVRTGFRWLNTFQNRHMLLLRAEAGGIFSPDFDRVPPSVRFYAGGDNSVRGFDFRSISPRNEDGDTVGGQYLLTGSVEYNWRWRPTWRPAVFVDAGSAFTDTNDVSPAIGVGVGMRWISPVGPVRIDVANGISEPNKPFRIHLTLGAAL